MIFFDEKEPNKYRKLKRILAPYKHPIKKVKVGSGDGGYVVDPMGVDTVLSYGIGDDPYGVSFETEMLNRGCRVDMYDGSIDTFPVKLSNSKGIANFYSEHLNAENFKLHVKNLEIRDPASTVLKMDIEGHEYDWLTDENFQTLYENFAQFTIEVHSLIEEVPEGWIIEPQMQDAKNNPNKVLDFFEKVSEAFSLWHIHGNNHAPRYVDFPDSLELTYLNKDYYSDYEKETEPFPIKGLDEPNFHGRDDYVIDWFL